ncbi:MAG: hypothetical protein HGA39_07910 [Coriobacteriia bacterium]|nr:hypothetical protein [Coriobacteriia bacterium]
MKKRCTAILQDERAVFIGEVLFCFAMLAILFYFLAISDFNAPRPFVYNQF